MADTPLREPVVSVTQLLDRPIWRFDVWLDGTMRAYGHRHTEAEARRTAETIARRLTLARWP